MRPERVCWVFLLILLFSLLSSGSYAQTHQVMMTRAYQAGREAGQAVVAERGGYKKLLAERYREILLLSRDPKVREQLKAEFKRGYEEAVEAMVMGEPKSSQLANGGSSSKVAVGRQEKSGVEIYEMQTARRVESGKPVNPSKVFSPTDSPIFFYFKYSGIAPGSEVRTVWRYLGGEDPDKVEASGVTKEGDNTARFNIELSEGRKWPVGEYRIDLYINGNKESEAFFSVKETGVEVSPPAPRLSVPGPALLRTPLKNGTIEIWVPPGWKVDENPKDAFLQIRPEDETQMIQLSGVEMTIKPGADLGAVAQEVARKWEEANVAPEKVYYRRVSSKTFQVAGAPAYQAEYKARSDQIELTSILSFFVVKEMLYVVTCIATDEKINGARDLFDKALTSLRIRK